MKKCPKCRRTYGDDTIVCLDDGSTLAAVKPLRQDRIIGDYRLISEIGRGGMGIVYRAIHTRFKEECALKVINEESAREPEFKQRFEREVAITRHLEHRNVVKVLDAGPAEGGLIFLAMEYAGENLASVIKKDGALPPKRALRIAGEVCAALAAAHKSGIIHRDIKPENILISQSQDGEVVKVADFGIAKIRKGAALPGTNSRTQIGVIMGTPEYCPPEQARGKGGSDADGRSDLYSLGVVLYEMLTGRPPFSEEAPLATLVHHIQTIPPPPSGKRPDIPRVADAIVMKALEKEPSDRFQSAEDMRQAILDAISELQSPIREPSAIQTPRRTARDPRLTPQPPPVNNTGTAGKPPVREKVEVRLVRVRKKPGLLGRMWDHIFGR